MNRRKSTGRDLPPRMLRRKKTLASGKVWVAYYYNKLGEAGKRIEIPLGSDLNEAKRKWAEIEGKPKAPDIGLMNSIFDRYERDVLPTKSPRSQKDNIAEMKKLRIVFGGMSIEAITPQHVAQYRDALPAYSRCHLTLPFLIQRVLRHRPSVSLLRASYLISFFFIKFMLDI